MADHSHVLDVLQAVPEQLWDSAVCAYHETEDQEGLYRAWRWNKSQAHDWLPSNEACFISTLLSVAALHSQPAQGCDGCFGLCVHVSLHTNLFFVQFKSLQA